MINVNYLFRKEIHENTKMTMTAKLVLANGSEINLSESRFVSGQTSFDDYTSASGEFEVGATIAKTFSTVLNNYDGYFDTFDFFGSYIVPTLHKTLSNGTVESIVKGLFYIDQPSTYGSTITIEAKDSMVLLDVPFSEVEITYPTTLRNIFVSICNHCKISYVTQNFPNSLMSIEKAPELQNETCRNIISYIAELACCYARIDIYDRLSLKWYDTTPISPNTDGGSFAYNTGAVLNGGSFAFNDGDSVDGGSFTEETTPILYSFKSYQVNVDDVTIKTVKVIASDEDNTTYEKTDINNPGYTLEISGNIFVTSTNVQSVCEFIYGVVNGMTFRPFSVSALGDPSLEAGDRIIIAKGNDIYYSYITHAKYSIGKYETYECTCQPTLRNQTVFLSASGKVLSASKELVKKEKNAREVAVQNLANQLANSSGLFMTAEVQPDGSTIYYMHDKQQLTQSQIVWKLTANAFGISTDGGKTYPYGLDVNGVAILNRIYAVGIDADYITSGTINANNVTISGMKTSNIQNDSGYQNASGVTSIVNGTVTTDFVNALKVTAEHVAAENITGTTISGKTLTGTTGYFDTIVLNANVPLQFYVKPVTGEPGIVDVFKASASGSVTILECYADLSMQNDAHFPTYTSATFGGAIGFDMPRGTINFNNTSKYFTFSTANDSQTIFRTAITHFNNEGGSGYSKVVASAFDVGSDIRYKRVIDEYMSVDISKDIINNITPIAFEYTDGTDGIHRGFSAQEIKEALDRNNIPESVYKYDADRDRYYLDKTELIPDMVNCIQDLYKEINALKSKIAELEGKN